jgi:TRAP-type mannitol/chloroaromatic compound transport system substrate-binding protein
VQNPAALRRLVAGGTKLRAFPRSVMQACESAAYEVYAELMGKSEYWKRIYPAWKKFRDEQFLWFRVAEGSYENYAFYSKLGEGR